MHDHAPDEATRLLPANQHYSVQIRGQTTPFTADTIADVRAYVQAMVPGGVLAQHVPSGVEVCGRDHVMSVIWVGVFDDRGRVRNLTDAEIELMLAPAPTNTDTDAAVEAPATAAHEVGIMGAIAVLAFRLREHSETIERLTERLRPVVRPIPLPAKEAEAIPADGSVISSNIFSVAADLRAQTVRLIDLLTGLDLA